MPAAPSFWHQRILLSYLLWPFSLLYRLITALRNRLTTPYHSSVPVVCVGNSTMGGAGKTPLVMSLAQLYQRNGLKAVCVSKGYKGLIKEATIVDPASHNARDVGDEPLLLASITTTIIAYERKKGIEKAESLHPDVIIMDDGLQNPTVAKDFSIVVFDGGYGIGNGFLVPAGPMREPLSSSLKKSDMVLVMGEDRYQLSRKCASISPDLSILQAHITMQPLSIEKEKSLIAFAGIGRPEKFFDMLKTNGYSLIEQCPFPDHHAYQPNDEEGLLQLTKKHHAQLVTTRKDYVKLSKRLQAITAVVDIHLTIADQHAFEHPLIQLITQHV